MRSVTKLLADRAMGCVLSPKQTTLSVRSKNNIENTPSPVSPKFMGVASPAKEALFGLRFLRPRLIKYVLSDLPPRGGRSHWGPLVFACWWSFGEVVEL